MPERPIILFGQPNTAEKAKRSGGASTFQRPSHNRQVQRLAPKMTALQNAVAILTSTPAGVEAEKTLVFDVAGDVTSFYTAIKKFGNDVEWIFDIPDDFEADDDFYVLQGNGVRADDVLSISGKVYCVLSNARAMEEILSLWRSYSQNPNTAFPYGKTGLKHIFENLRDIHFWGYRERVEETGILDIWQEELQDPDIGEVRCEFELFYRKDIQKHAPIEIQLRNELEALGGTFISSSVIPEIAYHSVLASVPRTVAESIIGGNKNVSITTAEQIMFFRPIGQAVVTPRDNSYEGNFAIPDAEDISEDPVVALFDGLPQENHPYLQGRLVVDDPDNYTIDYIVEARKHGTSMASIIALGDLSEVIHSATHKIYVRPIMKPYPTLDGHNEEIPADSLLVDKIHVAVRRLFEADAGESAPSVKVINLSIGISYRQFDRAISPLARLLDWLSWKYRVLFVVSAGNHSSKINTGMPFADFTATTMDARDRALAGHICRESRNMRLLSPAESISALTVGATFEDAAQFAPNALQIMPCSDGLPSAFSSVGMGLNNAVKPDILYPGGRSCVREDILYGAGSTIVNWQDAPSRGPGTASAAPLTVGGTAAKVMYTYGTSNSAALISHEASRCYDTLIDVFKNENKAIPGEHLALLIKAMLVHGAQWDVLPDIYTNVLGITKRQDISRKLYRYLGYGKPTVERAIECAQNRVTLIGYGDLKIGEALVYDLPLPFDFSTRICRRMTATLAYFPPVVPTRQKYRAAQLWFTIENGILHLLDSRVDVDWQAVVRGSVQHEIYENDAAVVWDENRAIQIKVNCRGDADDKCPDSIPYALMVSFEIKDAIDIDVYEKVVERVSTRVTV
jgi:hypothetical protein